jgi:hypothetical protein
MKKIIVIGALSVAALAACSDEKKSVPQTTPASETVSTEDPAKLIDATCKRDFGTAQLQKCVADEKAALNKMNALKQVPQGVVEKCAQMPNSRYSSVLSCIQAALAPVPTAKKHIYAMEEDGEYGYEGGLSQNEKDAGKSVNPIFMFRYLGEKNGTFTVGSRSGPVTHTASCKDPCEFIKLQTIYAGEVVKTETVRSTGNAVVDAVLQDARAGQLEKYKAPSKK